MSLQTLKEHGGKGARTNKIEHNLRILDQIDPEESKAFQDVLSDATYSSREISNALADLAANNPGYRLVPVSERTIAAYRQDAKK